MPNRLDNMLQFIDALYGPISLNVSEEALTVPELQRLRSVRLCNINSPYITGGDGLNRFEHAIGTAYLAQLLSEKFTIEQPDKEAFILAALYHDIVTAPFGHSLEYLFEAVTGDEYEHANIWQMFLSGKTVPISMPIYFNNKFSLNSIVDYNIIEKICSILSGNHVLSKILVNDIDIDNIDNVYRFAYHIGIRFDPNIPINLALALNYDGEKLLGNENSKFLFSNWFEVREMLYGYLLENEGEFQAKALLERAFIESIKDQTISLDDWILTDYEIIKKIFRDGNEIARECINRLMTMKFCQHFKILSSNDYNTIDEYLNSKKIELIDEMFSNDVFVHFIRDVNKTRRPITIYYLYNSQKNQVGTKIDRYLVGFFSNKKNNLIESIKAVEKAIGIELKEIERNNGPKQQSLF